MISVASQRRLIECMERTWANSFGVERVSSESGEWATEDRILSHDDVRLLAMADLIIPFAEAGLIPEQEKVGWFPSATVIRERIALTQLDSRALSVGAQMAVRPGFLFVEAELEDEWSTWLTYWSYAYSPPLRGTLGNLGAAAKSLEAFAKGPWRRDERTTLDGEYVSCFVPMGGGEGSSELLDSCEVVLEHVGAFRALGRSFVLMLEEVKYRHPDASEDVSHPPFNPGLWPYTVESLRRVFQIAALAQTLAKAIRGNDEGDAHAISEKQLVVY